MSKPSATSRRSRKSAGRGVKERKGILFVITKMNQGGAIVVPMQAAAFLRARGLKVETWFLYRTAPAYEDCPGVRLMLPHSPRGPFDHLRILWRLFMAMRECRPEAVFGVLPLGNVFGLWCAWLLGCRSRIASQHTPAQAQKPVMLWMDKLFGSVGLYSANVAVSHSVFNSFKSHPASYLNRLRVIQNGVAERRPAMNKSEARGHFGLSPESLIVGTVGRLSQEKNHEFLFQVVHSLPGVHMAIVGGGELEARYRDRVRSLGLMDRVRLLGPLPPEQVPNFLAAIDIFLLPSKFEGLPIALIEAMQAGLPIIASDIPSVREVAFSESGAAMEVLGTESVDSWVQSLRSLRDDSAARMRLSEAAKRRSGDFGIERMAYEYLDLVGAVGEANQDLGPTLRHTAD